MGGNATAIDRETGNPLKPAQKFDLKDVPRDFIKKNIIEVLKAIDTAYEKEYKKPLWDNFDAVNSGTAFNGSSESLFNDKISDEEFLKYKSKVGDIDVTVPTENLSNLFELLKTLERKNVTSNTKYWGQPRKNLGKFDQINAVFEMDYKGNKIFPQIDFEASEYKGGKPGSFSKFSHSADWEDIKKGFKGVTHKYWLMSIVTGKHTREDAILLTPASKEWPVEAMRIKTVHQIPRFASFSIASGIRFRLKPITNKETGDHIQIKDPKDGEMKFVYKEIPTEESDYINNLDEIFKFVFGKEGSPEELKKMGSFLGLVELSKKYLSKEEIKHAFNYLIEKMWGYGAQELERDNVKADEEIKMSMINLLYQNFPFLKSKQSDIDKAMKTFYSNYKSSEERLAKFKKESTDFTKFYYLED